MSNPSILVLGAYGLAGRAIVRGLLADTPYHVVAAGRKPDMLRALAEGEDKERLETLVLDVADKIALRTACDSASLVINAVGPYAQRGADTAAAVVKSGRPYIDCANEQIHYQRLRALDAPAKEREIPVITAAGAIPGCSSLLMAHALQQLPEATAVDCYWAQFRHAYAESGLGSMMSGILEAVHRPVALSNGQEVPILLGRSMRTVEFPEPFGMRKVFELPTIDTLTVSSRFSVRDLHTWFYMGDLPTWFLSVVRLLQPHRRRWSYRLVERIMDSINKRDTEKAITAGIGPDALLMVKVRRGNEVKSCQILFKDGAVATACLPVRIVLDYFRGHWDCSGVLTPLDLFEPKVLLNDLGGAVLSAELTLT
ncbi:MAG TPA: saccharopine dehydrogenase NADP-binding domain-containing protein [Candidatus Hydrogenedentes bacterium]|nr:saccharopine dehydrogenase NADP-binding domain-containing protein [Candidatus Hydrogenedentota bacterium]